MAKVLEIPMKKLNESGGKEQRKVITNSYDLSIDSIVTQIDDQIINLKDITNRPKFQRNYFWKPKKASRLVESILLNVPIPSCYFAEDKNYCFDVIDGQQRLLSLHKFIKNEFKLTGLEAFDELEGLRYSELPDQFKRKIRVHIMRCVVITNDSHPQVKFDVFERLNSDATPLKPQEIRNCVFNGKFNDLLGELAGDEKWLLIRNRKLPDERLGDEEIVLRFFSYVLQRRREYKPPLKHWLNSAADLGSDLDDNEILTLRKIWHETIDKVLIWFEPIECFRRPEDRKFNMALFDLITYTARKSDYKTIKETRDEFRERYSELLRNDEFTNLMIRTVDSREFTFKRISLWKEQISDLGL